MSQSGPSRPLIIAIDGPAGAGKSTLAKIVADRLGYLYVDTGAMYRALALKALRMGIDLENDRALAEMASKTDVRLERTESGDNRVFLDGADVTREVREPAVTAVVSRVSAVPELRHYMVHAQRAMAAPGGVVMDGRDIGSHVLPNADLKFYLTASLEERARRRQEQLAAVGHTIPLDELIADIARRDKLDMNKGEHSLVILPDSIIIDTSGKTEDESLDEILSHCRRV
ncbi:MAG: (d)CMP kinase [Bacillota bacterium]